MIFNNNAALLDALVLAIVKKEDTYGYEITRVLLLPETFIEKFPLTSVIVPAVVPFTITVAPIIGSPSSAESTLPDTVRD